MVDASQDIVIVGALRTAIGNFNGGLATVSAPHLGAHVIKALLERSSIEPDHINEVIMGQVLTAASGQNPARQTAIHAGLPVKVPAWTVNQVCGSGLKAIMLGAQSIKCGDSLIVIAGGQENMSLSPHAIHMREPTRMGNATMIDTMITDGLWDAFNHYHMGITAENIAKQWSITRAQQDKFAFASHQKAAAAQKAGIFQREIVPYTVKTKKSETVIEHDEFIKPNTTYEALAGLRPAFDKEGSVTAGNASGLNDGAAAVILTTRAEADRRNLPILARIVSYAQAGVDPAIMGTGPIDASRLALAKACWNVDELDLIEANEAFAAQAICVNNALQWDPEKVNVHGGATALGHPIGASGARVLVTLLNAMQTRNAKKGLATLCIGGGMGVALCVERH